jgi:hypothetical protein
MYHKQTSANVTLLANYICDDDTENCDGHKGYDNIEFETLFLFLFPVLILFSLD